MVYEWGGSGTNKHPCYGKAVWDKWLELPYSYKYYVFYRDSASYFKWYSSKNDAEYFYNGLSSSYGKVLIYESDILKYVGSWIKVYYSLGHAYKAIV